MSVERRLPLESDAGPFRQREIAAVQLGVIGKAAEGAEYAGIGFRAAEPETGGNGERHLIAAVRKQCAARPAVALEHRDGAGVLHDAVSLRRVDLDNVVALRTQPAEAHQVFHVLRRKQIFAGRQRRRIARRDLREQGKIEWVARLLEPAQPQGSKRIGIGERLRASEFGVGVDRELRMGRQHRLDCLDPSHVVAERQTSDLHLDHGVTGIEMAAHLVLQIFHRLPRGVPAAADVAEDPACHRAAVVALGQ